VAADAMTTEKMAFMIRHTSGYVCAPLPAPRARALALPAMVADNADPLRTAYTVTVDALGPDLTTGISAANRAHTVRTLADPEATAASFRRPGHVVPLVAREGLTRARRGHTEAALELCRLAGRGAAAAICEMVVDGEVVEDGRPELVGGRMMRRDDCLAFGMRWGIKVCTIEDMVVYVEAREGKWKGH
jgi:3,4-dihydroxy 2-butanone 4-phosphate synthase